MSVALGFDYGTNSASKEPAFSTGQVIGIGWAPCVRWSEAECRSLQNRENLIHPKETQAAS
ncbi:MAG: hypothetical protein JO015_11115 [Verrucomicrobia bacterium]|nr:hypothetical protein [Verrucomicrobiota bacterium]